MESRNKLIAYNKKKLVYFGCVAISTSGMFTLMLGYELQAREMRIMSKLEYMFMTLYNIFLEDFRAIKV